MPRARLGVAGMLGAGTASREIFFLGILGEVVRALEEVVRAVEEVVRAVGEVPSSPFYRLLGRLKVLLPLATGGALPLDGDVLLVRQHHLLVVLLRHPPALQDGHQSGGKSFSFY